MHTTTNGIVRATRRHLTSDEAYQQVAERLDKREITDACAATIASWWQSPGPHGRHLASLASGQPTDRGALLDEIHLVRNLEAGSARDRVALDMLATWAINGGEE
jgi:hypothetical protein